MISPKPLFLFLIVMPTLELFAQTPLVTILDSGRHTSLRGLSVVDDQVIWASGSNGTVARSTDGGRHFQWLTVQGYEQRDFRDIEAFDASTAVIMAVAEPAVILKTGDGGQTWRKVFEDTTKGMFLDAMAFSDKRTGVVIGDPIDKRGFIARTEDAGESWTHDVTNNAPPMEEGEGFFAASGTNVVFTRSKPDKKLFTLAVSGGTKSRIFYDSHGHATDLPLTQGAESTGANSIACSNNGMGVIVGGDFANDGSSLRNCILFTLEPTIAFIYPQTAPHGYRSCAAYIAEDQLIACGTSGVDISKDGGLNWELISTKGFHVCQKAKQGSKVFLAGPNGKIAMLSYH